MVRHVAILKAQLAALESRVVRVEAEVEALAEAVAVLEAQVAALSSPPKAHPQQRDETASENETPSTPRSGRQK